jgi:hypothetical protein
MEARTRLDAVSTTCTPPLYTCVRKSKARDSVTNRRFPSGLTTASDNIFPTGKVARTFGEAAEGAATVADCRWQGLATAEGETDSGSQDNKERGAGKSVCRGGAGVLGSDSIPVCVRRRHDCPNARRPAYLKLSHRRPCRARARPVTFLPLHESGPLTWGIGGQDIPKVPRLASIHGRPLFVCVAALAR